MAADTAVTITSRLADGKDLIRVLTGVRKLQPVEKIQAGISVWGQGQIGNVDSDVWLDQFIRTKRDDYDSLESFAVLLRDELRRHIPALSPENAVDGTIGFHLCGFTELDGTKLPNFYHIHNGRSTSLERRGLRIDPTVINANHDFPPDISRRTLEQGMGYLTSNGDYRPYREIFGVLESLLDDFAGRTKGDLLIPMSSSLTDRSEWLRFKIETMARLYRLAGVRLQAGGDYVRLPTIGGEITTLTITSNGIKEYQTR
jgi:hypothetical protein